MILVLWLARLLNWGARLCVRWSRRFDDASDRVYFVYHGRQNRKALRASERAAVERVIAESRTPIGRVGPVRAPIHRDR